MFSIQRHLSTSLNQAPGLSNGGPQFHMNHFRQIVQAILLCPPSLRATPKPKRRKGDEADSGSCSGTIDPGVRDMFMDQWLSEYDDIRWFFLRESAYVDILNA